MLRGLVCRSITSSFPPPPPSFPPALFASLSLHTSKPLQCFFALSCDTFPFPALPCPALPSRATPSPSHTRASKLIHWLWFFCIVSYRIARGDKKKALYRLRAEGSRKTHHFSSFRTGTMLGLAVPALVSGVYQSAYFFFVPVHRLSWEGR